MQHEAVFERFKSNGR